MQSIAIYLYPLLYFTIIITTCQILISSFGRKEKLQYNSTNDQVIKSVKVVRIDHSITNMYLISKVEI